jgi:putative flippase GtrA
MVLMSKLFFQVLRFATVGGIAAIVHFSTVVLLVEGKILFPLSANIVGFLIAFQVSYAGHRYWTFRGTVARHKTAFTKLFFLQTFNFAANEGLFYIFLTFFALPYPIALLLVLAILPVLTFSLSKFWVFK